ncbi:hypothetical protein [Alteromonas stellipolaris]|uniref:hypothetical protein n=1 Tax=Alteromonas stellipolaris TaxID=233316 RepID=UPI001E037D6C|nr:hypothetical protein [Alteromonas stellipolaris]MBZ2163219.1 hypothetical protein [Alteromonas stellipolaris]
MQALIKKLESAKGLKPSPARGVDAVTREKIHRHNSAILQQILSDAFSQRPTHIYMSTKAFTVYAQSNEDAIQVRSEAREQGFRNINIYENKDPDSAITNKRYGIDINASDSLLIGEHAPKFFDIIKQFITPFTAHITHKFGHFRTYGLTFDSPNAAELCARHLRRAFTSPATGIEIPANINVSYTDFDQAHIAIRLI